MNNNEIEKRLASAVDAATPDMLDSLMEELKLSDSHEPSLGERLTEGDHEKQFKPAKPRRGSLKMWAGVAAVFVMLVGVLSVWEHINNTAVAVIDLDVNPSIELSVNGKEKVIGAVAVNEDGNAILSDMDLKGSDVSVACNAIVGSMLTHGYLNENSNSILVSVAAKDAAKGQKIEKQVAGQINDYMDNATIAAAIVGQYVDGDDELEAFAAKNGISTGKAWLIRRLMDSGSSRMTEDSLLKLSTQELITLSQERSVASDTTYGKADTGKYIDKDKALSLALEHAGLTGADISNQEIEMDCENGIIIYEVDFHSGSAEYEYEINAIDGTVIKSDQEKLASGGNSGAAYDDDDDPDDNDRDDDDDRDDDSDDNDDHDDDDRDDEHDDED